MRIVLLIVLMFSGSSLFAQLREKGANYNYGSEFIWAVQGASNSGLISGITLRYGRKITDNQLQNINLDFSYTRHPLENKIPTLNGGNSYIWGKSNYLVNIRAMYGREMIIFKKAPQKGVQINGMVAGGLNLAQVIPYYYLLVDGRIEQIGPRNSDPSQVIRNQSIFYSISNGEISTRPGLSMKASLMFEYGTFKSNLTGFEFGFMCDVFFKEIIIMEYLNNRSIYPAIFINIIFGSRF